MTIEEISELINDEDKKILRKPKSMIGKKYEEILNSHKILKIIIDDVIKNNNRESFINSMFGKRKMRSVGITKIKNVNKNIGLFNFQSNVGDGMFFDAHKLFENGEYPADVNGLGYIIEDICYNNAKRYFER